MKNIIDGRWRLVVHEERGLQLEDGSGKCAGHNDVPSSSVSGSRFRILIAWRCFRVSMSQSSSLQDFRAQGKVN